MNESPKATVYIGCFECDAEDEFVGFVDDYGDAHFPCHHCGREFVVSEWDLFFDDEEEEDEEE
jgi:transposase-like protein